MTREEIIEGLKLLEDNMVYFDELLNDKCEYIDVHELLFEAIEVLEQEPCEDCIKIPEGTTNGDVIKAVFGFEPRENICIIPKELCNGNPAECDGCRFNDFWNSPYRKEQE